MGRAVRTLIAIFSIAAGVLLVGYLIWMNWVAYSINRALTLIFGPSDPIYGLIVYSITGYLVGLALVAIGVVTLRQSGRKEAAGRNNADAGPHPG